MNKDLLSYVKVYKSAVPTDICDKTIIGLQSKSWSEHNFYNPVKQEYYTNDLEPKFTYEGIDTTKNIMDIVWKQIENYVVRDLQFSWWNSWQGFNLIKFNKYSDSATMAEHCDHIHDMFDGERKGIPILSVVGLLNDEFEGGNFVILKDEVIPLTKGDIVIFPSLFLYPHRVESVTNGTRYSFASWVW